MEQRDIDGRLDSRCFGFLFLSQSRFGKKIRAPLTGSLDTRLVATALCVHDHLKEVPLEPSCRENLQGECTVDIPTHC